MENNEKKYEFMVYLDNKGLAKQSLLYNIPALTDYMLPISGLPCRMILEISNGIICFKSKYRDFEHGEIEKILTKIKFEDLKDFEIIKTNDEGVYHITMTISKFQSIGLNCSNGLNDKLVKEITDYVKGN